MNVLCFNKADKLETLINAVNASKCVAIGFNGDENADQIHAMFAASGVTSIENLGLVQHGDITIQLGSVSLHLNSDKSRRSLRSSRSRRSRRSNRSSRSRRSRRSSTDDSSFSNLLDSLCKKYNISNVDIIACSMLSLWTDKLKELEQQVGVNIRASNDATGNLKSGGNWIQESDDVNIAGIYFDKDKLKDYDGLLVNYTGQTLTDHNFSSQDLTDANFTNAILINVNFEGANLTNATFTGADLTGAKLSSEVGGHWLFKHLTEAQRRQVKIGNESKTDIQMMAMDNVYEFVVGGGIGWVYETSFIVKNSCGTVLIDASGSPGGNNLPGTASYSASATLPPGDYTLILKDNFNDGWSEHELTVDINLDGIIQSSETFGYVGNGPPVTYPFTISLNLSDADLTGVDLQNVNLTGALLTDANLTNADLSGATLVGVKSGSIMGTPTLSPEYILTNGYIVGPNVDLTSAILTGLDLTGATLTGVKSGSIVDDGTAQLPTNYDIVSGYIIGPNVDLQSADLSGVNLSGATLTGAKLSSEVGGHWLFKHLTEVQRRQVKIDNESKTNVQMMAIDNVYKFVVGGGSGYIYETSFIVKNSSGTVLIEASGSPGGINLPSTASYSASATLPPGDYTLTLTDAYNDGWQGNKLKVDINLDGIIQSSETFELMAGDPVTHPFIISLNLSDADLTDADLSGANLQNVNLTDADLSGANLTNALLINANFTNINLTNVNFTNATMISPIFTGATTTGITWTNVNLIKSNFTDAILTNANFTNATMISPIFTGATTTGITWTNVNLIKSNFTDAILTNANFTNAKMISPIFTDATTTGITWTNVNMVNYTGLSV